MIGTNSLYVKSLIRRYTQTVHGCITSAFCRFLVNTAQALRWLGDVKLTIPLTLGMVAAAPNRLDRLAGRLRNLIITLI